MKVLVIGAGVIGVTYAWQLSKSGNNVSLLVRKEKKELIKNKGLIINCIDLRGKRKMETKEVYRPEIVCEINEGEGYELIIVPVNSNQIKTILPALSEYKGSADILFFHNKWSDNKEIEEYLEPSRYLFGFPFKAGAGRNGNIINAVIFGDSICATMLGESDVE
jgi:2-dehydropantoate 2-reductase